MVSATPPVAQITAQDVAQVIAEARARQVAERVTDPELPMLTLVDLGVLREVSLAADGTVVVTITPTYSGCPAMATMRDDLRRSLADAGFADSEVRVALDPAWSSDDISTQGRATLAAHGISPPASAARTGGPIALTLVAPRRDVRCPRCSSGDAELTSEFGSTACKAMYRCRACLEPFDHIKEI